ncbi:MAG: hypothetical protein HYV28_15310 [Ignavibacteriales bacterium]|nr:hypothetical protein [Ignavibacteriales bacterium]
MDFCSPVKNTGFLLFRDKLMATTNGGATWSESVLHDEKGEPYFSGIHPYEAHLNTVYFSDRLHGWIGAYFDPEYTKLPFCTNQDGSATKKHGIFKTIDGGKHWAWIPVDVKFPHSVYAGGIQKIQFIDNKYGWFWGDDSYSLDWIRSYSWALGRTTDGGLTWQIQSGSRSYGMQIDMDMYNRQLAAERNDSSIVFYDFSFIDRKHGWAIGRIEYDNDNKGVNYVVFRTSTGGNKWNVSSFLPNNQNALNGILFLDRKNGYLAGQFFNPNRGKSLLLKTTTGGVNWDTVYTAMAPEQTAQLFFGTANSFALFTTLGYDEEAKHTLILSRNDSTEILNPVPGKHFFHLLHNTAKKLFYTLPEENDSITEKKYFHVTGNDQLWELPYSATNYDLTDIKALDSNYAIAIGKFGTIVETTDGTAWQKVAPPFPVVPNSIFITPDRTIRIACDSGIVLFKKYTDKSFRIREIDSRHNLRLVKFINDSVGHIMSDSILYVTSDGGVTYEEIKKFPYIGLLLSDFDFAEKENGFVFGQRRRPRVGFDCTELLKTTNGGMKWKDILFKFQWGYSDDILNWGCYLKLVNAKVAFLNADTGYILTDNRVYETKDCGTKWLVTNKYNIPVDIQQKFAIINPGKHFLPEPEGMLSSYGVINTTLETLLVRSPIEAYLNCPMSLYDGNNGWLCGKNGLIIKINMDN